MPCSRERNLLPWANPLSLDDPFLTSTIWTRQRRALGRYRGTQSPVRAHGRLPGEAWCAPSPEGIIQLCWADWLYPSTRPGPLASFDRSDRGYPNSDSSTVRVRALRIVEAKITLDT